MKWCLYNLAFALVYPFLLPGFLVRMVRRGGYAKRFGDRFALYPAEIVARFRVRAVSGRRFVWIHAVSVGEVQVAGQLMREWRLVDPAVRFCVSTTSSTGWSVAVRECAADDMLVYAPLDFPNFVKSAVRTIDPCAVVLTESEIWPNLIRTVSKAGIPLFLINARVSDRSAPRYRWARFFFGDVFRCFTRIFAQSDVDRDRLVAAGAPIGRIEVTGSFKFDAAHRNEAKERELDAWIGGGRILLGGSIWPGEDKVLLSIYRELVDLHPDCRLVLAPRHFEKADAVEANVKMAGFVCVRRSRGERGEGVLLCDTTGELMGLYGVADVVFVGKSLCAHGSQNMIEPCLCGKPTLVGPWTENFRPVMRDLLSANAIEQVKDAEALRRRILSIFDSPDEAAHLGKRAREAVQRRCGVVLRCVKAIRSALCLALVCLFAGCADDAKEVEDQPNPPKTEYVFAPVRTACRLIGVLENPEAISNAVVVKELDVREMTAGDFRHELEAMPGEDVHVWMPGRYYWLLVGRITTNAVSLAKAMDVLSVDDDCRSLPALFANYAGTRDEMLPAFSSDLKGSVVPEWFVTREIPQLPWLDLAGIDSDILGDVVAEMRAAQIVRREVLSGDMLAARATNKDEEEKAEVAWASAAEKNPEDLFILERLDRLERNAKGFLEVDKLLQALKCYETMVIIQPKNAKAVFNFGMCLKKIGKLDMAEKVLKRAEELAK